MATLLQSATFLSRKSDGTPNSLGKLYTYAAGTLTGQAAYTTAALNVEHTNPIVLDAAGTATVWLDPTLAYRLIEKTADDVTIRDVDNFSDTAGGTGGRYVFGVETQTATDGQTAFTLSIRYIPGTGSLLVSVDGLIVTDYTETSESVVTFTTGLVAGQEVSFRGGAYVSSGVAMSELQGGGLAQHFPAGATDDASYYFRRRATYSGGTPGFVNGCIKADTFVESAPGSQTSSASSFEWAIVGIMRNYSSLGENTGIYGQGLKYGAGPTWGMVAEVKEMAGTANPTSGTVALEVDVRANGTDTNGARVGVDLVIGKHNTDGDSVTASYGYRLQDAQGPGFNRATRGFTTYNLTCDVGFDTSQGTIDQAAFKMAAGQAIAFNADSTRKLYYDGGGLRFTDGSNTIIGRITDSGSFQTAGGVQVVGARNTGWAVMTGTANKAATYDTASVTTAQLAGRVMALQEALALHGLIGT